MAENLSDILERVSLLNSPAAKQRLLAKSIELKMCFEKDNVQMPKELLLHLVRMGSFSSTPKILNDDNQDNDLCLPEDLSRNELLQYCQKYHLHPMVKRCFRKANESKNSSYGLKFRKLNGVSKGCSDYIFNPLCLRVFQWNILSQALGENNDHFVRCPTEALDWNNRKFHLIEEILEYYPDVICLQEVDHFNFLKRVLKTQGYSGMFYPKPDSPCFYIDGNNGPDGCAIFFRSNKFELTKTECKVLEVFTIPSNQVVLLAFLKIKETGHEICIATTHLKARNGMVLSSLRNEQGKDLLKFLTHHCDDRPIIVCGDFNAEPTEPIYSTVLNSKLNLASAYADCSVNDAANSALREPPYTTWKIREEGEICHTIDYIFYSKSKMEVEAVLELPTSEEIGNDRVPSFSYPSDHFSLCCDLKLRRRNQL